MTTIRRITFNELCGDPEFQTLVDEYADESAIKGMPEKNPDINAYNTMERIGMQHVFAAYADEKLVGFVIVLITPVPHYSCKMGSTEITMAHRKEPHLMITPGISPPQIHP